MEVRGLTLDAFQVESIQHLMDGHSVLVCAPTGTGKTIIADWIVDHALKNQRRVVYTAPIKALSNQKYRDYCRLFGSEKVGLVTGDLVINRDAPCRVMTTEILRNMLLSGEDLSDLMAVIVDEIHFLDDPERGTVWEEVLIYLPDTVQIVGLSATLSNRKEFASWLSDVRGRPVQVVQERQRAVPLSFYLASTKTGMVSPKRYDELWRRHGGGESPPSRGKSRGRSRKGRQREESPRGRRADRGRRPQRTRHVDIFRMLKSKNLLPYLYFAFSRRDIESFARTLTQALPEGLLSPEEKMDVQARLSIARQSLGPALDRELAEMYTHGIAFHHAGLHVQLKSLVESLYERKLIKVLYCTSTFALGINMPARTVVFDGLTKYNGTTMAPLTVRQFMQKAGRAGRRGMDDHGHVVIRMDPEGYEEMRPLMKRYLSGHDEPVHSSFRLSWNSIVNLLDTHDEDHLRQIVQKSFLNWHLAQTAERHLERARSLEASDAEERSHRKQLKEARRLRKRVEHIGERVWVQLQDRIQFLQDVGYLDEDLGLNAGARVLRHLQIQEILVTELVLAGTLEPLAPPMLFGVLCGLVTELPRSANRLFKPRKIERRIARSIQDIRMSPIVMQAGAFPRSEVNWDPNLLPLGRMWAEGRSLQEVLSWVRTSTDIAGDLISGFRRAKDLAGQLKVVYADLPDQRDKLQHLIRLVSRDEVEVVG